MASAASPADVARTLRRARRRRGVSLSDATEATRIDARYLEALENDAPIEDFPAPAYARFFLKEYAQFLSLDDRQLLAAFEEAHPLPENDLPDLGAKLTPIDRRPWPFTRALVTALSVIALVTIAVVSFVSAGNRAPAIRSLAEVPTTPPGVTSTPGPAAISPAAKERAGERQPAPGFEGITAVISITERSWIQATVDGRVRPGRTLETGEQLRVRAERRLALVLGNAGGVELRVNGKSVRTGGSGEVVNLSFRVKDGRILRG